MQLENGVKIRFTINKRRNKKILKNNILDIDVTVA